MAQFYYDSQLRRYLLQFTRMFSNFSVGYGPNPEKPDTLVRVPVRYGDASRQAQTIIQQNSANNMPSSPLMTFYITRLEYDRPRMQNPTYVDNMQVRQRQYDAVTNTYSTQQGNAFTVERLMPVPYRMTLALDIWTSNTNQKFQLWEQIAPLFNPALEIQATDNFIDWTTITVVELTSNKFTSKTIPVGTEDPIDIATFEFEIPIWISSPVKIKKLGVVERIIASVFDENGDLNNEAINGDLLLGTRQCITPFNYQVLAFGVSDSPVTGRLQCLSSAQPPVPSEQSLDVNTEIVNSPVYWDGIINLYGVINPGISYIALMQPDNTEVICYIAPDPTDGKTLLVTNIDRMPANTLPAVDAIIDPLLSGPLSTAIGTRYLLTEDTGLNATWNVTASKNDIIEYNGTNWVVSFDSAASTSVQYVTNITTTTQYIWDGIGWQRSIDGFYNNGSGDSSYGAIESVSGLPARGWRIVL